MSRSDGMNWSQLECHGLPRPAGPFKFYSIYKRWKTSFSRIGGRPAHSFSVFWVIQVRITRNQWVGTRDSSRESGFFLYPIFCLPFAVPQFSQRIFSSFQFCFRLLVTNLDIRIRSLIRDSDSCHDHRLRSCRRMWLCSSVHHSGGKGLKKWKTAVKKWKSVVKKINP
jgi:hypothetical protein